MGDIQPFFRSNVFWIISLVISLLCGVNVGWRLGRSQQPHPVGITNALSNDVKIKFVYNRTFAEAPSNKSDAAWETLFPIEGGFFKHPQLAPDGSGLAVFHQLHCLDNIRQGYWAAVNSEEGHHHTSAAHIRHCIDYLRQSLMCHADNNIEPIDETLNGVRGFGVEHTCHDFDLVKDWVSEWEEGIAL